jgi:hypothetical protein
MIAELTDLLAQLDIEHFQSWKRTTQRRCPRGTLQ